MSDDLHPEYIVTSPGDGPIVEPTMTTTPVVNSDAAPATAAAVRPPSGVHFVRLASAASASSSSSFRTVSSSTSSASSSSSSRTVTQNVRSHSLQSSHSSSSVTATQHAATSGMLHQQIGAVSAINLPMQQQQPPLQLFKSATTSNTTSTVKGKFQSFLQQPDSQSPHPHSTVHMTSTATAIGTAVQQQRRQFVRSTSAHSEGGTSGGGGSSSTTGTDSSSTETLVEKFNRSASAQIDDYTTAGGGTADVLQSSVSVHALTSKQQQQHVAISEQLMQHQQHQQHQYHLSTRSIHHRNSLGLSSKSAETMNDPKSALSATGTSTAASLRSQLTLSGNFLAPPSNRKLTILSPIHAPASLSDMLKRHAVGRSPLSPRIGFPGSEVDLFA